MTQCYIVREVWHQADQRRELGAAKVDGYAEAEKARKQIIERHAHDAAFVTAYLIPCYGSAGTVELVPNDRWGR